MNPQSRPLPFWPLFWTQFFGALNDNYFKNALVILLTFRNLDAFGMDSRSLVAISGGIFILPFIFLSPYSGQLSDKWVKSSIAVGVKIFELLIMVLASFAFYFHRIEILFVCLFLMGIHSTLFGPIKYSLIPELLPEEKLVKGNALIESGTFLAILIGTLGSGLVFTLPQAEPTIIGGILLFSTIGLLTSLWIPRLPAAAPHLKFSWNFFTQVREMITILKMEKSVFNGVLGISWFWFLGGAILSILPTLTQSVLNSNAEVVTLFLGVFTLGIGAGSLLAEKISHDRIEIGLVPLGSFGMSLFLLDLGWSLHSVSPLLSTDAPAGARAFLMAPGSFRILGDFLGIALSGGFFTVPLYTLMQSRSQKEVRSRVIGANNLLNALFMVASAILLLVLYRLEVSFGNIFLIFSALNFLVSIYIYKMVPEFLWRLVSFVLARLIYRVKPKGLENIPKSGAALLLSNHVSFIDWLIIQACVGRPIRFVIYYKIYRIPVLNAFFRHSKTIPIAGKSEDQEIFKAAFHQISQEIKAGELVCIFPEGSITHDGKMQAFKKGMEFILQTDHIPVVPMAINGLWGSLFSRKDKTLLQKRPRKLFKAVTLTVGESYLPTLPLEGASVIAEAKVAKLVTSGRAIPSKVENQK
jgi:1-acyl-sn-glycerol-3-phosphate acyltransferase